MKQKLQGRALHHIKPGGIERIQNAEADSPEASEAASIGGPVSELETSCSHAGHGPDSWCCGLAFRRRRDDVTRRTTVDSAVVVCHTLILGSSFPRRQESSAPVWIPACA